MVLLSSLKGRVILSMGKAAGLEAVANQSKSPPTLDARAGFVGNFPDGGES